MSDTLWPNGTQHARIPCPLPTPWACSNSRPLSQWCHPTISSSVIHFFSCLQCVPASGSFLMSQLFISGGQSIGASASASVLFFFFSFFFISWRLITLQYCSGFCHTLTWISHGFTCIPHPDPPSHLPLYPIPLGLPSAPGLSTCLMHPTWAGDLFYPRQYTFRCCSLETSHPHLLPQSPKDCSIHLCLFFLVIHFKRSSVCLWSQNPLTILSLHLSPLVNIISFSKSVSLFLFCKQVHLYNFLLDSSYKG